MSLDSRMGDRTIEEFTRDLAKGNKKERIAIPAIVEELRSRSTIPIEVIQKGVASDKVEKDYCPDTMGIDCELVIDGVNIPVEVKVMDDYYKELVVNSKCVKHYIDRGTTIIVVRQGYFVTLDRKFFKEIFYPGRPTFNRYNSSRKFFVISDEELGLLLLYGKATRYDFIDDNAKKIISTISWRR